MGPGVAADERAGTGAETLGTGRLRSRLRQTDVGGVAEVVVRPEVEERAAVERHHAALPAAADAVRSLQAGRPEGVDLSGDPVEGVGKWAGRRSRACGDGRLVATAGRAGLGHRFRPCGRRAAGGCGTRRP